MLITTSQLINSNFPGRLECAHSSHPLLTSAMIVVDLKEKSVYSNAQESIPCGNAENARYTCAALWIVVWHISKHNYAKLARSVFVHKLALGMFRPQSISLCCLDWPVSEIVALKKEGAFCGFLSLCSFPERWIREWWPLSGPGSFHPALKSPSALKGVQDCTISALFKKDLMRCIVF